MNDDLRVSGSVMLTGEELKASDDFRFGKRMPSRAAAVRELSKRGLAAEGFKLADGDTKSSEYGAPAQGGRQGRRRGSTRRTWSSAPWARPGTKPARPIRPVLSGSLLQIRGERCRKRAADDPASESAKRWPQLAAEYEQLANALETEEDRTQPRAQQQPMQQQPMQQQQSRAEDGDDT